MVKIIEDQSAIGACGEAPSEPDGR